MSLVFFQNINRVTSNSDLKPAVYNEPEGQPSAEVPLPNVLQVQQVHHYEEVIESPTPQRIVKRPNPASHSTFCCCFLTLLTLIFIFLCFFAYRKHLHLNGELGDFKAIKKVELRSTNLPLQMGVQGGTIILIANDGTKGIIDQRSFSMMAVSKSGSDFWSIWANFWSNYRVLFRDKWLVLAPCHKIMEITRFWAWPKTTYSLRMIAQNSKSQI